MSVIAGWGFVVLPDTDSAVPLARRLARESTVLHHPSGRPWLVHNHPAEQVAVSADRSDHRLAVVGFSAATPASLNQAARHLDGPDRLARELDGSFWVVASFAGRSHALGSALGVRRIFRARIDGVWVASDRADVLAELGSFDFDETTLAMRTIMPLVHPLSEEPLWRGVEPVAPGDSLTIEADGNRCWHRRWWTPPGAELDRRGGAQRLRDRLAAAVATRTSGGGVVHSDLSGGFDSTPVTYFASLGRARVVASTAYNTDPGGREDLVWARKALPVMRGIEHSTMSLESLPAFYLGLSEVTARFDEPSETIRAAPRIAAMIQVARSNGARVYLNGLGGDHLLSPMPAWDHTLLRRRPLTALRRVRTSQLLEGTDYRTAFLPLLRSQPYRTWFGRMVEAMEFRDPYRKVTAMELAWDQQLYWPRWLTTAHRAAVTARLRKIAGTADPLAPALGDHAYLAVIRGGARVARAGAQLGAAQQVAFESPFLDDRVVEACLATRIQDRGHPKQFKPLIRNAMQGLLPDDFLRRTRKTSGDPQASRGIRAAEPELIDICHHSVLAERGIIDLDVLRSHAFPRERWMPVRDVDATLTCALFARNHTNRHHGSQPTDAQYPGERRGDIPS
ncbi:asparagine synthase-related protein [Micromonospora carbonacea]|uniref:asparagine synthase (glutamine-hydrolyzing) n=1 Tax=Micromonospora carbonacea TaxID=47853 RepID=A0A1C5AWP4_9ACTN|nr:asparagine synthase-related protein [Micromonospora carbonacea]SCF49484.1 asparagine synthase (glutamine-hydrolysing) [Micromonospora carbonacea]